MIYGRFHSKDYPNKLQILRLAVLDDVKRIEGRRPDKTDKECVRLGSYVVVKDLDGQREDLYHVRYLKADGGWDEIVAAIAATKSKP